MPASKKLFASEEWRQANRALLPARTRLNLDLLLARFDLVCEQIDVLEKEIQLAGKQIEDIRILQTIPGVGPVIAATIHAEIPDVTLFDSGRALACFAGIVPSVRSSGGKTRIGRITKRGPSALRWALTQAVHASQSAKEPSSAYELHRRKKKKGKAPKVALCAAANKLARTIFAMLKNRTEYRHGGAAA
jgi:transposase